MTILTPAAPPHRYRRWRRVARRPMIGDAARERRVTGWLGLLAVPLILFGTSLAAPEADQSAGNIAAFYTDERIVVLVSQAFAVTAGIVFFAFAGRLSRAVGRIDELAVLTWSGRAVAMVTLAAAVVISALTVVGSPERADLTLTLASTAQLIATLQLLAVVAFAGVIAIADIDLPVVLRSLAGIVAMLALGASAARWAAEPSSLELIAPMAFVIFVGLLSIWLVLEPEARRVNRPSSRANP